MEALHHEKRPAVWPYEHRDMNYLDDLHLSLLIELLLFTARTSAVTFREATHHTPPRPPPSRIPLSPRGLTGALISFTVKHAAGLSGAETYISGPFQNEKPQRQNRTRPSGPAQTNRWTKAMGQWGRRRLE